MDNKDNEGIDVKRLKEIYRESGTILSDEEADALADRINEAVSEVLSEEHARQKIPGKNRIKNEP